MKMKDRDLRLLKKNNPNVFKKDWRQMEAERIENERIALDNATIKRSNFQWKDPVGDLIEGEDLNV